jgi:hypothetical protein
MVKEVQGSFFIEDFDSSKLQSVGKPIDLH